MGADSTQVAQKDVQDVKGKGSTGDQLQTVVHDVQQAREQFKDPKDYANFMNQLSSGMKQNNMQDLLPAMILADPKSNAEATLLRDMTANNNELYKILDTYSTKQGKGQLDGAGSKADGQVGKADIDRFLQDAKNDPNSEAAKQMQKHPELGALLAGAESQKGFNGFDETRLLNDLGYQNIGDFTKANPGGPQELKDSQGRVQTVVEPNGTATGFHYDQNNQIDGMNVTDVSGHNWSYHRGENGKFVDQNNNPVPIEAPSVAPDGTYSFYSPVEGNNQQMTKHSLDPKTGQWSAQPVDRSQMPQTAENPQGQTKPYQVQDGDNLTNIARQAMGKPAGYEGEDLQAAIAKIAKANNIDNYDVIMAGTTLNIPS